jgi:hypothetical protein
MKQPHAPGSIPSSSAHLQWCHRASSWCSVSSTASPLQLSNLPVSPPLEVTSTTLPLVQTHLPQVNFSNGPFSSGSFSAEDLLAKPRLGLLQAHDHTLFVSEAKTHNIPLEGHVPQAVCEMYACAKQLGSVGCLWCFPILNDSAVAEKNLSVEL